MAKPKKKMRAPVRNMRPLFVAAYLAQPIGKRSPKQAAIDAGYSAKTASAAGSRLLADVKIQELIAKAEAPILDRYEVTAERVIRELALIGFSNMMDYGSVGRDGQFDVDLRNTTRDQAAAISEVVSTRTIRHIGDTMVESTSTKLKTAGKRQALETLGRYQGLGANDAAPATSVTFNIIGLIASTDRKTA